MFSVATVVSMLTIIVPNPYTRMEQLKKSNVQRNLKVNRHETGL